ncbi:MAG: hypothetical protein MSH25_07340 [Desulfovibrio sp.]|uniref:hypothetical protein n=1 Tax=Desulfovibrio sp. TaxID=885 RepID=UPI0025BFA68E|nr:hypothetical protein [Desulfovibrio sp.]MCI7569163.1 hypothetical protein [Desulfovibrio sp.]
MSKKFCPAGSLRRTCLVLLLACTLAHAALLFLGSRSPLTSIPLYAPGFEVQAEGMSVHYIPLAGRELRSVVAHANG